MRGEAGDYSTQKLFLSSIFFLLRNPNTVKETDVGAFYRKTVFFYFLCYLNLYVQCPICVENGKMAHIFLFTESKATPPSLEIGVNIEKPTIFYDFYDF